MIALLDAGGPLVRGMLLQVLGAHAPHGPQAARVRLPAAAVAAVATSYGSAGTAALAMQTVDLPCKVLWRTCSALASGGRAGTGLGPGDRPATWATFKWASGREVGAEARGSLRPSADPAAPAARGTQAGRMPAVLICASSEQTAMWAAHYGGIWGLHTARRVLGFCSPTSPGLADALPATAASQASGAALIVCRLEHVELTALAHLSSCAVLAACVLAPDPVAAVASRWLVRPKTPATESSVAGSLNLSGSHLQSRMFVFHEHYHTVGLCTCPYAVQS